MLSALFPCLGITRIRYKGFTLSLYFNSLTNKAPLLEAAKLYFFYGRMSFFEKK